MKLLELFSMTGLSSNVTVLTSDNATNFCATLNRELMHRLGVRLRFSTPGHPQGNSISERYVGIVKHMISNVARDHPRGWHRYLPYIL